MKRKTKKHGTHITVILAACMLAAILLSAYLALKPELEQKESLDRQSELMESIRQGDGAIVLDEATVTEPVDFYEADSADDYDAAPDAEPADLYESGGEPLAEAGSGDDAASDSEAGYDIFFPPVTATESAPASVPATDNDPLSTVNSPLEINGLGILTIDKIGLELPVTEGVTGAQLKISAGHVPQTAAIGGVGNAVVAGHRSYEYGHHFNRLDEVEQGDMIRYLTKDGMEMTFIADEILEIQPGDQSAFHQPEDKAQLTLYTCTPIRVATRRLLVRATRIN